MYTKVGVWFGILFVVFSSTLGALSSSLQRLYVANEASDSVSVIDPALGTVVTRVPTGSHPHNVNVDPSGRYFYVTNYGGNAIQVFDVQTNALIATVQVGHQPAHVVPDPTGKTLYVSNEGGTTLSIIGVPQFKVTETLELKGEGPHGHVISPDGRLLLTPNSRSRDVSLIDLIQRRSI